MDNTMIRQFHNEVHAFTVDSGWIIQLINLSPEIEILQITLNMAHTPRLQTLDGR
jgi:hypothetical protein